MMSLLQQYFPEITNLFPYQIKAIDRIMGKENTLCIVPTGGGKSLIFQLAAMELPGTTLVISPLKALMDEQVNELRSRNIEAICLNSDLPFEEQRKVLRSLQANNPKLIYISPERLFNYFFRAALLASKCDISLVTIDEAHCISQWGIDFRPEYGNISPFIHFLRENGHNPTILALTATMGIKARADIVQEFGMTHEIIEKNVIRDNLELHFQQVEEEEDKWDELISFIDRHELKKVLVYLYSKSKCEELSNKYLGSGHFHAGLSYERKAEILKQFKTGEIPVLFSTTAFGMGINIPDIDGVVHYHIPDSIEEYYQHVGRGARDRRICPKAKCLFLWSETNFDRKAQRIKSDTLNEKDLAKGFEHLTLCKKAGKKTYVKWEVIYNNDGSYGSTPLSLVKRMFEKHGVCETVGDVHGSPLSITFKNVTSFWSEMVDKIKPRNQFLLAEKKSGKTLQEIIDYVYEQELKGNVSKLPATERTLFLLSHYDELPGDIVQEILQESMRVEEFKLEQLAELRALCNINNKNKYIADILGVPY